MVRPIREATRPLNILEVGPGTGPFTRQILRLMSPEDTFTICEINPRFLELLRRNLEKKPYFQKNKERVRFFQGPVQELPTLGQHQKYDIIISSLPFTNFTPETVEEILSLFREMTADGGSVNFMEYLGVRRLSTVVCSQRSRERLARVDKVIQRWYDEVEECGEVRKKLSLFNLPPAFAIELAYHRNEQDNAKTVFRSHC